MEEEGEEEEKEGVKGGEKEGEKGKEKRMIKGRREKEAILKMKKLTQEDRKKQREVEEETEKGKQASCNAK